MINFLLNLQTKHTLICYNAFRLIYENLRLNQVNRLGVLIREC